MVHIRRLLGARTKALEALKAIEAVKEAQDCMTARPHDCKTARMQDCKTARPQDCKTINTGKEINTKV